MTKEHIKDKFFGRLSDRVTIRLPDDVKEMLFEFAEKNGLLEFEYINDLVIPFIRTKNGDSMIPSKEEWVKSIKDDDRPYEPILEVLKEEVEKCPYHAVDGKGQWWCEIKKIEPQVCFQQFRRFQAMNRRCRPLHRSKIQIGTKVNVAVINEAKEEEKYGYYCYIRDQRFKLEELPCLIDPMMSCPNKKCEEEILSRIKR